MGEISMDPKNAKIRINLSQAEIEIEGTEEFVEKHLKKVEEYLQLCKTIAPSKPPAINVNPNSNVGQSNDSKKRENNDGQLSKIFGEWIHKMPSNATDQIKILFAGYYTQKNSEGNCFNASSVNQILKDHGIKVANSSTTVKRLNDAKKIFQIGKTEGLNNYRLTRESEQELINILLE